MEVFRLIRLILVFGAGWVNQQQEHVIDYLQEEIRVSQANSRG